MSACRARDRFLSLLDYARPFYFARYGPCVLDADVLMHRPGRAAAGCKACRAARLDVAMLGFHGAGCAHQGAGWRAVARCSVRALYADRARLGDLQAALSCERRVDL